MACAGATFPALFGRDGEGDEAWAGVRAVEMGNVVTQARASPAPPSLDDDELQFEHQPNQQLVMSSLDSGTRAEAQCILLFSQSL